MDRSNEERLSNSQSNTEENLEKLWEWKGRVRKVREREGKELWREERVGGSEEVCSFYRRL